MNDVLLGAMAAHPHAHAERLAALAPEISTGPLLFLRRSRDDRRVPSAEENRSALVTALEVDLIGPFYAAGSQREEVLPLPPSRWYWAGFLAPEYARDPKDPNSDDEMGAGSDEDEEEGSGQEQEPKQKKTFAASLGLSVLLPPKTGADRIAVTVRFAEYVPDKREVEGNGRPRTVWRRVARGPFTVDVPIEERELAKGIPVPDAPLVHLTGQLQPADAPGLARGTRALALFLVNHRQGAKRGEEDADYLFQVQLELAYEAGFVPRPNRSGELAEDEDDRVADLQFRDRHEWAVGHGVAVEVVPEQQGGSHVTRVRTTFLPHSEVRRVVTNALPTVDTDMRTLAALTDGGAVRAALSPLAEEYGRWIASQREIPIDSPRREETRAALVENAERARARIRAGIERLAKDQEVFSAFCLANEAMADAAERRDQQRGTLPRPPKWHLFQLAFLLLNLESIADERSSERENVELIFFPTGGGKTEAYLGVIAFTLLLRRMRGLARPDQGLGVAVLLRYTLRLLTLDQLGRTATLMCALELIRQRDPGLLGRERFAVGLWVGRSATANTMAQVHRAILEYRSSNAKNPSSPFPLPNCPHCGEMLPASALQLVPNSAKAERVIVGCGNVRCAFSARRNPDGLPVLFVDEQIYRELPCFLVATVDKFAMLPWRGETGMLFGRARARSGHAFYGPLDDLPKQTTELPEGLRPPELIVQDELHLISGPLGTMVGLYETAIEYLCTRKLADGKTSVPKVLASTATVRRARAQIRALFGRRQMSLFPPPGVDDAETFFASVDQARSGRLYVGVAAHGRSLKGTLLRTYVALLAAAQRRYDPRAAKDGDPYMTLAGYFNSLRELGGMRRLVEDDVRSRCLNVEEKFPLDHQGDHPWFKKRDVQMEPVELTSRESTSNVKQAKERLNRAFADPEHVDVLLASNMISVGVDIDRLGLMVVAGQPKTTSEYIQATSRVGRQHPGLVVTCFNLARPRDRSHYERFATYHESFYRFVEAMSLTPFSGPALERGLAATLVAMTRLATTSMTAPERAMAIQEQRAWADQAARVLAVRAGLESGRDLHEGVYALATSLIDSWERVVQTARDEAASTRPYSRFDRDRGPGRPLLFTSIDEDQPSPDSDEGRFSAPTSMRDVEQSVHLWVRSKLGGDL